MIVLDPDEGMQNMADDVPDDVVDGYYLGLATPKAQLAVTTTWAFQVRSPLGEMSALQANSQRIAEVLQQYFGERSEVLVQRTNVSVFKRLPTYRRDAE